MRTFLLWTPRVLTIAFAAFISIFALDVFGHEHGFWKTLVALLMHLIPTALILLILALAWRREWVGTIGLIALGVTYIVMFRGRFAISVYFGIAGPLIVAGLLFLASWLQRRGESPAH